MNSDESQTQGSFQSTPPKNKTKEKKAVKKTVKKHRKHKEKQQLEKTVIKSTNNEKVKNQIIGSKKKYRNQLCKHSSVFQKLLVSIIFAIISLIVFAKLPKTNYFLAQYTSVTNQGVFQIITDRRIQHIKFNLQMPQTIGIWPFTSVKSAMVKAKLDYTIGYEFQNMEQKQANGVNHHQIQMSDLKILHYHISKIELQNQQNGLWNSWTFEDNEQLEKIISSKYIKHKKEQILSNITEKHKEIEQKKVRYMVTQLIEKSQTWFNWFLKRMNKLIDGGLQPYIKIYQLVQNEI